ncbi:MAG TPA: class A beta-lactamase-related serine hydrolase [Anaerolineaceae bacterium]|nr:class A beta-lactamase-related serine hydrolase [Anaerolineaceae bacterium]HPN50668.1 class A beta-lactamase-related serine hydrolase [Anaerolineaceae bacterium]
MDHLILHHIGELLDKSGAQFALYVQKTGKPPFFYQNHDLFYSASIIKIPILLSWVMLEREGLLDRRALCDMKAEPPVQGAGLSWLLATPCLTYQDVLLMMIALSDNLCTNLIIRRIGLQRLNETFRSRLKLAGGTRIERKLFDYAARARGLDNYVSAADCIHFYSLMESLRAEEKAWVDPMFAVNDDTSLLLRNVPRDSLTFHHKTGSIPNVLHDWGYTDRCRIFLLTQNVRDERQMNAIFGELGELLS